MISSALTLLALGNGFAVQAQPDDNPQGNTQRIEEVTVLGTDPARYRADATLSLTGMSLNFLELPRVVETIPEHLFERVRSQVFDGSFSCVEANLSAEHPLAELTRDGESLSFAELMTRLRKA